MYDTNPRVPGESGALADGALDDGALADPVLPRLSAELLAAYLGTEVVAQDGTMWSGLGALDRLEDA